MSNLPPDRSYIPDRDNQAGSVAMALYIVPLGTMRRDIDTPERLGATLRQIRRDRGLRLEDVALAAGVGIRFVSELERGKPTVRLAPVLSVIAALGARLELDDRIG